MNSIVQNSKKNPDPIEIFKNWLKEAKEDPKTVEHNAMLLSTQIPAYGIFFSTVISCRVILLKEVLTNGLIFYTNYNSLKYRRPKHPASITFYWPYLKKQVRMRGYLKKTSKEKSQQYWNSRSFESQVSQYISKQSQSVPSQAHLEKEWKETKQQFDGKAIPRPPHWGGLIFTPFYIEFWKEKPHRLHERVVFQRQKLFLNKSQKWKSKFLYP